MTLRVAASALRRQVFVARRPLRKPDGRAVKTRWQSTSAQDAARQLFASREKEVIRRTEILDGIQLQKLSLTLGRRELWSGLDVSKAPPPAGTVVPPGYHLVYFTPAFVEDDLGLDGTDKSFNPPPPFTRRMWAGGSMSWAPAELLRVGQAVEERTTLRSAVAKKSRDGSEMILVEVLKEFSVPGGRAPIVTDKRDWIFRPEVPMASDAPAEPAPDTVMHGQSTCADVATGRICEPLRKWSPIASQNAGDKQPTVYPERRVRWSPVGLFRFSALTFNGHRIHYDGGWARRVERHPAPVVHGPLNLIGMLDYWRDACGDGGPVGRPPDRIGYRAWSPLYAGDEYSIQAAGGWVTHPEAKEENTEAKEENTEAKEENTEAKEENTEAKEEAGASTKRARRWDVSVQKGATLCMTGSIDESTQGPAGYGP